MKRALLAAILVSYDASFLRRSANTRLFPFGASQPSAKVQAVTCFYTMFQEYVRLVPSQSTSTPGKGVAVEASSACSRSKGQSVVPGAW
jgi:hypothetical protein